MAPKKAATKKKKREACSDEPPGMFDGMVVFLVENGVQPRRLQIWKGKLMLMGATIEDHFSRMVTHIFAVDLKSLLKKVGKEKMTCFNGSVLPYQWLEDSLKSGQRVSEESYNLKAETEGVTEPTKALEAVQSEQLKNNQPDDKEVPHGKKARSSPDDSKVVHPINSEDNRSARDEILNTTSDPLYADYKSSPDNLSSSNKDCSLLYSPPDLNRNITDIFGKLIDVYRALGDDRRSFSYHKAIPVIEKLPFKIESVDQVKHLPNIGKGMQDHIHEIITTGKLSKFEHFETDEKVKTITLFGDVWGIGPATALKLYEKGHRTLEDLKNDDSLTKAQKLGLKYFEDIKKRIPRNEVQDMEFFLQKAAENIMPGVVVLCGGSFRRGKATCGDMDIIITHPDGQSHKGFLARFVKYLKEINFLREDLIYSTHSEEGTDSGVDTYFGLCTYPGRETRHRIDLKVYSRSIYAFGLIAWTGNDVLNRRLRLLADSKGYRLDDTGLFLATQGSGGKWGQRSSTSLSFKTEKEVFDFLGFPWLEPNERNL